MRGLFLGHAYHANVSGSAAHLHCTPPNNITSSDEDYEDSSDQAANSDQDVSINAAFKKQKLCNFNESDEKCFGLLEAYDARYNYFTHFDDSSRKLRNEGLGRHEPPG